MLLNPVKGEGGGGGHSASTTKKSESQIILATPATGISDPLKRVSFALVVFSCGIPLSELNTSDGITFACAPVSNLNSTRLLFT